MQWANPNTRYSKMDSKSNQYSSQKSLNIFQDFCAGVPFIEDPEGVKWDWDWPKIWVVKWDLIHWDGDFCTGNGTQNIKWEQEFCFNPLSKKDFLE